MLGLGWMVLQSRGKDRLELSVSGGVRALFATLAALSLLVLLAGVLLEGEATVLAVRNTVPFLLLAATLWGALQEDRWTFDRTAGTYGSRYGLVFLARCRRWPLAGLERIEVDRFTRGRVSPARGLLGDRPGRQDWVRLLAVDHDGEVRVLDLARAHRIAEFRQRGEWIASFCGVRFEG